MKYLKYFENIVNVVDMKSVKHYFDITKEELEDFFIDFNEGDFIITVRFRGNLVGGGLPQSHEFVKLGFIPLIEIKLVSKLQTWNQADKSRFLDSYINSNEFINNYKQIESRLDYHNLYVGKLYIEGNQIIFLIYKKNNSTNV